LRILLFHESFYKIKGGNYMNLAKKAISLVLATTLAATGLAACGKGNTTSAASTPATSGAVGTSKEVNVSMYLLGGEGLANKDAVAKINEILKKDINTTLTIKYIDWADITTKYPLLFASGEDFDLSYVSSNGAVPYSALAKQGSLMDITPLLDKVPTLKAAIPQEKWDQVKVNGKIYGIPNLYTEFIPYGFVSRDDLLKKYDLKPVTSISTMEAYMDAVVKNEKFAPLNGGPNDAQNLYNLFVGTTGKWLRAPGIPESDTYLVTKSASDYKTVMHPAFTQEFEDWAVKMHDWANKGYWPKDILSAQRGAKDNFTNGLSGSYITHMADWTGNYGPTLKTMPDVTTSFWCPSQDNGKILKTTANQNATGISINSKNPERALMVLEKLMTDETCYDLIQYGIKGRNYDLKDGKVIEAPTYDKDKDAIGFSGWSLRNDKFNIPYASEDPRRYTLNKDWEKIAIDNPYATFNFDPSKVTTELSAIANANSTLGIQIMLGKTQDDPKKAVEQYRKQLTQAGIDKVIAEVNAQLQNYTAGK
jgi:putative aldouronate transport system substrate-binding protein